MYKDFFSGGNIPKSSREKNIFDSQMPMPRSKRPIGEG